MVAEQTLAKCFGGFSSSEELVNLIFNRLSTYGCPDMVKYYMFYSTLHYGADSPFSTEGGLEEHLLSRFYHHVWNCPQRTFDSELDFIGDPLLQFSGDQVIIISWSCSRFRLSLFSFLTVRIGVIIIPGV